MQRLKLEITGQAEAGSKAFKAQWIEFYIELERLLYKFTALQPMPPSIKIEVSMALAPLQEEERTK